MICPNLRGFSRSFLSFTIPQGGNRAVGVTPEVSTPSIPRGSTVWVWDSTWLPAVVAQPARTGFVLVRFEHGVTCNVAISDLEPRDAASRGRDRPRSLHQRGERIHKNSY